MTNKYIFTVAAALALWAGFSGCSHDIDSASPGEEATENYNRIFIETFGQPSPDHTWGFDIPVATSRSAWMTRDAYPNANQWAAQGWLVPDPLTEGQLLRVQKYFQAVRYPGGTEDPHLSDFFVQQVYDGGTDPGPNSPEVYLAANQSTWIESGEHMDYLTCGSIHDHVFNFNNGNCSVNYNVLDNYEDMNSHNFHSDKIQLMLDSQTDCFGYWNSNASYGRDDRYRLVSAEVIDEWANTPANYVNGEPIGEDVVDKWNRDFIGFDFDQIPDATTFARTNEVWEDGKLVSFDNVYLYLDEVGESFDGTNYTPYDNTQAYLYDGKPVPYIRNETNLYCGTKFSLTDEDLKKERRYRDENDVEQAVKYFDKAKIDSLLALGYLPVQNTGNRDWIKIGGCADGWYSDWIVTIAKAKKQDDPDVEPDEPVDVWGEWKRIICEDLSVTQRTDFDFNDVVFDVCINTAKTKAKIVLLAAGGTLPLTVGWTGEEGTTYNQYEVHNMFGVATNVMVNTHAKTGVDGKASVTKTLTGTFNSYDDVKIMVQKHGEWTEITAHKGEPASKILVNTTYQWCNEREDISIRYNGKRYTRSFLDYVQDPSVASDWYE